MEDDLKDVPFEDDHPIRERLNQIRQIKNDIYETKDKIFKRMDEIEKLINSHAIGVQNVYEGFKSLKDIVNKNIIDIEHIKITFQE
jgi:hypothetical protein